MSLKVETGINLAQYTSWQIGGSAEFFCQPRDLDEMKEAVRYASDKRLSLTVLSGGSNVLISDAGVRGLVILMNKFTGTFFEERDGHLHVSALAGTPKSELLKIFLKHQLAPALFLAGLPGDVGGGVVMNAGIGEQLVPREFVEITDWIRVLRGQALTTYTRDQLSWKYRHCEGWQPGIIVEAGFSWPLRPQAGILERVKDANRERLKKQPLDKPSCGSVFRNPEGAKAGQLIESCGLKGFQVGAAQVSDKHANFIVNLGSATARDTDSLIKTVVDTVLKKTGYRLQTEVVYLGDWA